MSYFKTISLGLCALVIAGAGCAPSSTPSSLMALVGDQRWTLVSFNGESVPQGQSITFDKPDHYNAKFCNTMGGSYVFTDGVLMSSSTMSTMMACMDDRMKIEEAFGKNIVSGLKIAAEKGNLELRGNDGSVFVFSPDETTDVGGAAAGASSSTLKSFVRPNDFSIQYPSSMEMELGKELSATLPNASVLKISVSKDAFNRDDKNNFQEAFLVFSATTSAKINKDNFMMFADIPGAKPSAAAVQFNGYNFGFTTTSDAGAGNFYRTEIYRTVQNGKYYQAELTVHTTNAQNYTPARQEFAGDAYAPLRDVLRSVNFLR